jgi:sugar (pentulose or hexulose) kinase
MEKEFVMAVDSGTQSVRAIVYDRQGKELAVARAPHDPYFSLKPGWAEQKPDDYWKKFCKVVGEVMASKKFDPKKLAALGITAQRSAVIPTDKNGNALRNSIIWLDQRYTENPPPASLGVKLLFGLAGRSKLINFVQKNSRFTWIKTHEPEIYKNTYKFCQVTSYFVKKLTGEFADSCSLYVGYYPLEHKKSDWFKIKGVMDLFSVSEDMLPVIKQPHEILGVVTKSAAKETGLPEGLPIIVGGGDKQSESLGAGVLTPDIGVISFGTATAMEIVTKKYVEDRQGQFFTWCSAVPYGWNIECFVYRGFWMVRWFADEMGNRENIIARERGVAPEVVFDETIRDIPPGCLGLVLQPYWTPLPSLEYSKGSIIGFGSAHTRAHIYRAILEGMGYELRRLGELAQKKTGVPLKELRVGGGGSRSEEAVQIAADIFNLTARRMDTFENCAKGAAIDAAVGTGLHKSFEEAVAAMTRTGKAFYPNPKNREIYDGLYKEVYLKTYDALAPLYKKMIVITGYEST